MNNNKFVAAESAARIVASQEFRSTMECTSAWQTVFEHILDALGGDEPVVTYKPSTATTGGRAVPVVTQASIQGKIDALKVNNQQDPSLPAGLHEWAASVGADAVWDNRDKVAENPSRPLFRALGADGSELKDERGKSISYWGKKR
jgi:hypothetical protein